MVARDLAAALLLAALAVGCGGDDESASSPEDKAAAAAVEWVQHVGEGRAPCYLSSCEPTHAEPE